MAMSRRDLLKGGALLAASGSLTGLPSCTKSSGTLAARKSRFVPPDSIPVAKRPKELAYLAPYVHRNERWGSERLFEFLNAMSKKDLTSVAKAIDVKHYLGRDKARDIYAINHQLLWESSSIFTYPFKSVRSIDYQNIVAWCASEVGIGRKQSDFTTTFDLEQAILRRQFVDIWNKLDKKKRAALIKKIGISGHASGIRLAHVSDHINPSVLVGMSGAGALAALSATVSFSGFAFYTTMSTVIATVAGWCGVTVPFTAYMTASSTVAALAGPIGWAIGAVVLAGSFAAWAGSANTRTTTAFVLQLHCMKAGALYATGVI
jgi:uncharacterized protein YaaW (UPF0174 family)